MTSCGDRPSWTRRDRGIEVVGAIISRAVRGPCWGDSCASRAFLRMQPKTDHQPHVHRHWTGDMRHTLDVAGGQTGGTLGVVPNIEIPASDSIPIGHIENGFGSRVCFPPCRRRGHRASCTGMAETTLGNGRHTAHPRLIWGHSGGRSGAMRHSRGRISREFEGSAPLPKGANAA